MNSSGIYKILNTKTNDFYIGSAKDFKRRWPRHKWGLNNNKHHSNYLQNAWNKYSSWFFEFIIIEYCEPEKLIEREQFYIDTLKPKYNIQPIAGNSLGYRHPPEIKAKMTSVKMGNSYRRLKDKWPHPDGCECKCEDCKQQKKLLKKEWDEYNYVKKPRHLDRRFKENRI